jgi:hypothetical protein
MLTEDARQFFRDAAAKRRRGYQCCETCGLEFRGLAWQRHCSKRCRDRASQRAARARAKQAPAESH